MNIPALPTDADVTILGGGPVGAALALLLARDASDPARIVLCAPAPRAPSQAADTPAVDPRVMAVNHGSRTLLQSLGAWPEGGADILDIHVSQRGRLGRTHISHTDFNVPALGTVLPYAGIAATLARALEQSGITVKPGQARIASQDDAGVDIEQEDRRWRTSVCVRADGGTFDTQAQHDIHRSYDQHAILGTVLVSRPRPGWAWERFTREGPIALLPHPMSVNDHLPACYALVWCCTPAHAQILQHMDDHAFARELNEVFGTRLGDFTLAGDRHVYPLGINMRHRLVDGRSVAIGNAAQTLHPVAGQGLNLGLRDAARLAQSLLAWSRTPAADPRPALRAYAQARQADRWLTAGLTDFMPRVFTSGLSPVEHACGLALLALDGSRTMRGPLARQLMEGLRT